MGAEPCGRMVGRGTRKAPGGPGPWRFDGRAGLTDGEQHAPGGAPEGGKARGRRRSVGGAAVDHDQLDAPGMAAGGGIGILHRKLKAGQV